MESPGETGEADDQVEYRADFAAHVQRRLVFDDAPIGAAVGGSKGSCGHGLVGKGSPGFVEAHLSLYGEMPPESRWSWDT